MISILSMETNNFRTFGWVQDPGNLRSLCDVVAIFDENSKKHKSLVHDIIPSLIEKRDGQEEYIDILNKRPLRIPYSKLVGTAFTPRSMSRCNGIVQAAVKGQKRDFIGDWPADNFVRWAHCFGFIKYNYAEDSFEITQEGKDLCRGRGSDEALSDLEIKILIDAALSYPPAVRILKLLSLEDAHLTKFELGKRLGFVGEDGFTSMPQKILIQALCEAKTAKDKNTIKSDWEGSSDKYARMIASWLEKLGLIRRHPKSITVFIAGQEYTQEIGQSYIITATGLAALRRTEGKGKHKRIPKNVCWEMLATKGSGREYLRTRRSYILKYISEVKRKGCVKDIILYLSDMGLEEREETIKDDMVGLSNIGLNISLSETNYQFGDEVKDFIIPKPSSLIKSELVETKENLREKIRCLSHEYLSLIDLAYDSKQNRLFEMKTLELLTEECGFQGKHLGGSRKPDGVIYTNNLDKDYGVIIDTKAYSKGYNLPISQSDEMERYIGENQTRDEKINPNKWWCTFTNSINLFYFMFISGHFKGNFRTQLERISRNKGVQGTAISITTLLLLVEQYKRGTITHKMIGDWAFNNSECLIECLFLP